MKKHKIDTFFNNYCGKESIELLEVKILEFIEQRTKKGCFVSLAELRKKVPKEEQWSFLESCRQMEKHGWLYSITIENKCCDRMTPLAIQFLANWKQVRMNQRMLLIAFVALAVSIIIFLTTALMNLRNFYTNKDTQRQQIELLQEQNELLQDFVGQGV